VIFKIIGVATTNMQKCFKDIRDKGTYQAKKPLETADILIQDFL